MNFDFDAVIFDLNGTILSDEDEYGKAFNKVLAGFNIKTGKVYPHESGIGVSENWSKFKKKYDIKTDISDDELAVMTQGEYLKLLKSVKLREGFKEFVEDLRLSGIKIGLATSNTWGVAEKILGHFGIEKYFDAVTTREEVEKGKPDPEIFIKTAEKLNIEPARCIVFEDSVAGIKAARKAGMKTVGVARDDKQKKFLSDADTIVFDYDFFVNEKRV